MKNSFGSLFRMTSFGESHGPSMGVVIDGCPAGVEWDEELLIANLDRRRPGSSEIVSSRSEEDRPQILSGVFEGKTLGTPIAITIANNDQRSKDYDNLPDRQGHADDVWRDKFGHSDRRGGGRSSGRETVSRVIAGSVAQMFLQSATPELSVSTRLQQVGPLQLKSEADEQSLTELLAQAKQDGQSYGGTLEVEVKGVPIGLGQPVFHKLKSELASAYLGIGACNGFEFGEGFRAAEKKGTEFHASNESAYGGIRGGISTGEDIVARLSFKPTSSVMNVAKKGRHDPCIILRAQVVVEAMTHLVLADHTLWQRLDRV